MSGAASGPVFGAIDGGYRVLFDELVSRSGVTWVPAAVHRIVAAEPGWVVEVDAGGTWNADAVVLAVPAARAATLLAEVCHYLTKLGLPFADMGLDPDGYSFQNNASAKVL